MRKEFYAKVFGEVTGPQFQKFTLELAQMLTIVGYLELSGENSVEVVAQGEEESLKEFASALTVGPEDAPVESLEIEWGKAIGEFSTFEIR